MYLFYLMIINFMKWLSFLFFTVYKWLSLKIVCVCVHVSAVGQRNQKDMSGALEPEL